MENKTIDQKKYLQKYLNPKSKKKKIKKASSDKRVNIIDDDVDFSQLMPVDESEIDLYATGEDAPQIAGIIDERPIEIRLKEKFKFSQWKVTNEDDGFDSRLIVREYDKSTGKEKTNATNLSPENDDNDLENKKNSTTSAIIDSDNDLEVPRKRKKNDSGSEMSGKYNRKAIDSDNDRQLSKYRRKDDSDNELPQKYNKKVNAYTDSDEDLQLPRKNSKRKREKIEKSYSSQSDSDLELSRNTRKRHSDLDDSELSRKRRKRHSESDDLELSRNTRKRSSDSDDLELSRKEKRKNKYADSNSSMELSTKKESLKEKTKRKEINTQKSVISKSETNFNSEPSSSSTKNIVKFNIRNPDKEKQKADAEKKEEQKEKYEVWGRGLKQVSDKQQKMESEAHEMMKPLARYADDEDLENFLKEQEREGDPMLEYLRKEKREKNSNKSNESCKPRYEGAYMPNRFGIPPGYRWDGVDRSNGYEANWFNVQNSKKITEEEAYKWSVDDM